MLAHHWLPHRLLGSRHEIGDQVIYTKQVNLIEIKDIWMNDTMYNNGITNRTN